MRINTAYFEITNFCNLNCRTCYNRSGLNQTKKEISVEALKKSIDILIPLGLKRVLISGGEPTLHSEFHKILDLINLYNNISFGIVTNGTVHDEKLLKTLNENQSFTLQISLDGSNEEQNQKTRGRGNFQKSIEFAKQVRKNNPSPVLKMVVSQNNLDDIENFYLLAKSLDFQPEFAFIYKSGNANEQWDNKVLTPQQKIKALKLIDKLNNEHNLKATLPFCTDKCPYTKGDERMSICVKTDGSIQPCQTMYSSRFTLGNIFDFNIEAFKVNVNNFVDIAKKRTHIDFGCNKCILKSNCGKGCAAAAVNMYDDPLANDGDCEFRKLQLLGYNLKL